MIGVRVGRVGSSLSIHVEGILLVIGFDGKLFIKRVDGKLLVKGVDGVVGVHHLHGGLGHAGVAKAIKDIDIGHVDVFGGILQHGVDGARENVGDLAHEQGQEAVLTVAGEGDAGEDLGEELARADGKGVAGGGLDGEELGEGKGDLDQLLNEASADNIQGLVGEARGEVEEQITSHVAIVKGGGRIIRAGRGGTVGELPDGVLEPLLIGAKVGKVGVLAGPRLGEVVLLLLKTADELGGKVSAGLVPDGDKGVVKGTVNVDEHDEAVELVGEGIRGVVCEGGQVDGGLEGEGTAALDGVGTLDGVEEPVEAAAACGLDGVEVHVVLLLVHANHGHHGGGLAEVEPGLVVHLLAVVAGKDEEVCGEGVEGDGVEVVVALADLEGLFEEELGGDDVGAGDHVEVVGVAGGHGHAGLEHDKGAHGGHEAVGIAVLLHVEELLLDLAAVEDGGLGVHVVEEEGGAVLDEIRGDHAGGRGEGVGLGARDAVHAVLDLGGETGEALGLAKLADDLCAGALGAFLLGDGIVCAGQLGGGAVAAGVDAITFDLATMASIACSLDGLTHGG